MITYNRELWTKMLEKGKAVWDKNHRGITNTLTDLDIKTVLGTLEFFNASSLWIRQSVSDLILAKFRVFDWLGMCIMSRNDDNRLMNNVGLKVLVHSFIKSGYDEQKFITDLRSSDYQIDEAWKEIKIEGKE